MANSDLFDPEMSPDPYLPMEAHHCRTLSTSEPESGYGTDGSTGDLFTNLESPVTRLPPVTSFSKINPHYGQQEDMSSSIPSVVINNNFTESPVNKLNKRGRPKKVFSIEDGSQPPKSHRGRKQGQSKSIYYYYIVLVLST